jgi:parvulin-like peptidyl-prolyl isomerase
MQKIVFFFLMSCWCTSVSFADQILVTIGNSGKITDRQLEAALQAAPFATQFPAMDEKDQAYLRGDMLLRLARAEALYQQAMLEGMQQTAVFQQEMSNFKTSLLAQRYLNKLRQQIKIPAELDQQFKDQYIGNSDALTAARSAYIAGEFESLKRDSLNKLKSSAQLKTFFHRLSDKPTAETVLAEGKGIKIKYADLLEKPLQSDIEKNQIIDKVNEWVDLTLMAQAAELQGEKVDAQLQVYAHDLSIRLLLAKKEQQWISDEQILVDYFQQHPDSGYIPERWQIGQIVLGSKQEAEQIKDRILAGESLFKLAGQYSIDPYGRKRSGDMGWLIEGSAADEIEKKLKNLKDNELSDIIKTEKGWHLIVIVKRKPAERRNYASIKDRVRQKLISEKMAVYLQEVTKKFPLQWKIAEQTAYMKTK